MVVRGMYVWKWNALFASVFTTDFPPFEIQFSMGAFIYLNFVFINGDSFLDIKNSQG